MSERSQTGERRPRISVVIPVYNEIKTLDEIIARVRALDFDLEIVAVDDGSTDGTREKLVAMQDDVLRVILHEKNKGKAGALATGFEEARGDFIIIQDADLEYDPEEYPLIFEPLFEGRADVVFGSRFQGSPARVHLFFHYIANRLLTLLSNLCTNLNLTDMECCYKAFRREVLDVVKIESKRFAVEPELAQKVAKLGVRIYEVGVSYHGRDYSEGKKIGLKDAFEAVWAIFRYKFFWYPPKSWKGLDRTGS